MDRLEKSLAYLNWWHIFGAVLDVFLENQQRESTAPGCDKANADTWVVVEDLRLEIWRRARVFWCQRTGLDTSYYPYSVDGIARLYLKNRKRNEEDIAAFQREIQQHVGGASLFV